MKFDSKDKKILIFADPHQDIKKLHRIIKHESADINICLGDWFDSFFFDDDKNYAQTAEYLLDYLSKPNNYTLYGNHDLNYLFNNDLARCSGYEDRKYESINEIIKNDRLHVQNTFKWHFLIDGYLCTHAGLHSTYIPPQCKDISDINAYLGTEGEKSLLALRTYDNHWFFKAGRARGGFWKIGGIVWLDFNYEFEPIDDLPQIVGHTHRRTQKVECHKSEGFMNPLDANNLCIDTNLEEYLVFTDGKKEIKSFRDL